MDRAVIRVAGVLALAALVAAACGDDGGDGESAASEPAAPSTAPADGDATVVTSGEDTATSTTPDDTSVPASTATTATTAAAAGSGGCGIEAVTDANDLSVGRHPARCEPGRPAPEPLEERTTITLANAFVSEYVAPIILAQERGEFDKENLDVEIVPVGMEDALPQLANGEIDAVNGAPNAGWFNAHEAGIDTKWVLGNFFPADAGDLSVAQTGLWARADVFTDPADPDPRELEGRKVASAVGLASAISYPLAVGFEDAGADPTEMDYEQIPSTDMVVALQNGAVDAAWMLDPFWTQLADDDDYVLVATQTPGEPIGGIFFGERLLTTDREAGVAFLRAMIRTVNTYVDGDYHDDSEVMQSLSELTEIPVDQMIQTPALLFDWEIREGTTTRTQEAFIGYDVVEVDEPLPEDQLVDRSLYLDAVGVESP